MCVIVRRFFFGTEAARKSFEKKKRRFESFAPCEARTEAPPPDTPRIFEKSSIKAFLAAFSPILGHLDGEFYEKGRKKQKNHKKS